MADRPARLVTRQLVRRTMTVTTWVVAGVAIAVLALQLSGDRVGRFLTALQALTPWTIPVLVLVAVVAMARRDHVGAITNAAIGVAYLALVVPLVFPPGLQRAADGDTLTIAHGNLLYSNPSIDDAIESLIATDADVIALSELTPEFADAIAASPIGRSHPYTFPRPGRAAVGLGIWSRRPLVDTEQITGTTMTLTTAIAVDGRTMRLALTHPLPPLFNEVHWTAEIAALAGDDPGSIADTALVGDINVSYFHPPYRRFLDRADLSDVHHELGKGLSFSWPTDESVPPFVRLDHALVGANVTATAIEDFDMPGSDHRAFVVTVAWVAPD